MSATAQPFVILLVENEETDAYLTKWAFEESRIPADLHQVFDGREALDFLRRAGARFQDAPRPGLVLLDLNMPRMDGLECLAAIKRDQFLRDIPVVILSTSRDEGDMAAAASIGAADYFAKPLDIDQFVEAVRVLGERWILPTPPHY